MPPTAKSEPRWLLIVESSPVIRTLLASAAKKTKLEVVFAEDSAEDLQKLRRSSPVAIVTTQELRDLPGTSLIVALKSSPNHRSIPIALLTSHDRADWETSFHPPDQILHKSANLAENFQQFLRDHLPTDMGGAGSTEPPLPLEGKRILLAEDSTTIQALFSRYLHRAGAELVIAGNGAQAVEFAGKTAFDLILTDVEMPVMDGFEAIAQLRKIGIQAPILVATASTDPSPEVDLFTAGCNLILPKNVSCRDLIDACVRLIHPTSNPHSDETHAVSALSTSQDGADVNALIYFVSKPYVFSRKLVSPVSGVAPPLWTLHDGLDQSRLAGFLTGIRLRVYHFQRAVCFGQAIERSPSVSSGLTSTRTRVYLADSGTACGARLAVCSDPVPSRSCRWWTGLADYHS